MTDKEWKELCEWAREKELKYLMVSPLFIGDCIELYIEETNTTIIFYKNGMVSVDGRVIKNNLKQTEIKSIIENLL